MDIIKGLKSLDQLLSKLALSRDQHIYFVKLLKSIEEMAQQPKIEVDKKIEEVPNDGK